MQVTTEDELRRRLETRQAVKDVTRGVLYAAVAFFGTCATLALVSYSLRIGWELGG